MNRRNIGGPSTVPKTRRPSGGRPESSSLKRSLNSSSTATSLDAATKAKTTPLGERLAQAKTNNARAQQLRQFSASAKAATQRKRKQSTTKHSQSAMKKKPGKRFRRVKVLRWWVMPAIFLVPLGIIVIEYYLGKLIGLEDVREVYYQQLGIDPWDVDVDPAPLLGTPLSLTNITYISRALQCEGDLRKMINIHNPKSHSMEARNIPLIIHQRAPSRCLTRKFYTAAVAWASGLKRWSYYLHDDEAVDRLLLSSHENNNNNNINNNAFPEFPLLPFAVRCLPHPLASSSQLGADLWAFVTLWAYGGLFVDLSYSPNGFDASTTIHPSEDDALLWLDPGPTQQQPTPKIMAFSPRHPLLYHAIQHVLDYIVFGQHDNDDKMIVSFTGKMALYQAFRDFYPLLNDAGSGAEMKISPGTYTGENGRSVRIVGSLAEESSASGGSVVKPVFASREDLNNEYVAMGSALPVDYSATLNLSSDCLKSMYMG